MTKPEIAQLYSNRMHRSCVDAAVFNCWMLTNFQSDDRDVPELAPYVLEAVREVHDSETVATVLGVMVKIAEMEISVN